MNVKNLILAAACVIPFASHADEAFMDAQWKYRIVDNVKNRVHITGSSSAERPASVVIPAEAEFGGKKYTVTGIGKEAFSGWSNLTEVRIPESIRYLGEGAFKGCPLTAIHCHASMPPSFSPVEIDNSVFIENMRLRDPFIYADPDTYIYYTFMPRWVNGCPGIEKYESFDLRRWKSTGWAWDHREGYLGNNDNWAPDMYAYNGEHYIFVTFSRVYDTSSGDHWNRSNFEINPGTTLLKSVDGPGGKYYPVFSDESGRLNYTPSDMMAIDGSLYVDTDGQPWMIYSGELCQYYDGRVYAQKMKQDLSDMEGDPIFLFSASQSPWSRDSGTREGRKVYITDAPFIYRDEASGNLIMIWSSNSSTGYAVGQAISESGKVTGPWKHKQTQLNTDNGGHGMLFRDFEGKLMLSYHTTENGTAIEHMCAREVTVADGALKTLDMVNGYQVNGSDLNPTFDSETLKNAKVYVPRSVYMDYKLGGLWSAFSNIVLETSGVDDLTNDSGNHPFFLNGTNLILPASNDNSEIYSLDGKLICKLGKEGGETALNLKGIYILKTGFRTFKITI